MSNSFVLKGAVIDSKNQDTLHLTEQGYVVCVNGICEGVYEELPTEYRNLELKDYTDYLIIPGMSDLHLHAPQYTYRGLGMDLELLEWLEVNTFPEESRYRDLAYAERAYELFVEELLHTTTTRACVFATIHKEATLLLMNKLEKAGIKSMVGKVNMDRNAPDYYCEKSAQESVQKTREWIIEAKQRFKRTLPMITPRFVPTCSEELLKELGNLAREYDLPVQSHISENLDEIAWVKELCPKSSCYGDVYRQAGLFGNDVRTVMAHSVYSSEEEIRLMKDNQVFIAHCPQSNTNVASGIAPVRRYLDDKLKLGLGTDIAGGFSMSILRAMADTIQVSKLRYRTVDETLKPVRLEEAFYMATAGGGAFFGKVGKFEKGYEFDAVVLDDHALKTPKELSLRDRLERIVYMSEQCQIIDKYVEGTPLLM